jgi:hypothetical protein
LQFALLQSKPPLALAWMYKWNLQLMFEEDYSVKTALHGTAGSKLIRSGPEQMYVSGFTL